MKGKFFILELHDVAPCFLFEFTEMLAWAKKLEVDEPVVLITPKWPMVCKSEEKKIFIQKIKGLNSKIVMHGFSHSAPASLWDKIWYGENSGAEFKRMSRKKASQLISSGKEIIEDWVKQKIDWFCAPRWQLKKGTVKALKGLEFRGYLGKKYVYIFNGPKITIPALSFDHGKRKPVCALNRLMRQLQVKKHAGSGKPFRLVIHPRDIKNREVLGELKKVKEILKAEGFKPWSLDKMISEASERRQVKKF